MPLTNHQHPLYECEKPRPEDPRFKYSCNTCGETFQDRDHVYVCHECKSLLHESCLALPDQIKHPFHSEHPLKLLRWNPKCRCDTCGRKPYSEVSTYYCVLCDFNLDVHCATLIPTARNHNLNQGDLTQPISPRHSHPLIQCKSDSIKNFRRRCHGCNLPFKDFVYVCFKCHILLDKSCVDLLPDIFHPFHPQHRLILSNQDLWLCRACRNNSGNFMYICPFEKCRFSLDLKCARMELRFTKSDIHEHALAYFNFETAQSCDICNWKYSNGFFFRCVQCDFSIHDRCHPSLPQTIKHQCHCDPLTLTRSAIQDIPDEDEEEEAVEFYCFACEELRTLSHPTYYCAECPFVAHVHCVMSEILSYLERESMAFAAVDESKITQDDEATTSGKFAVVSTKGGGQGGKNEHSSPNATVATAKNVDPVLNGIDEKIAKLQEVIEEYTGRVAELQGVIDEYKGKVAELQGVIDEYKGRVAELQERRAQHIASVTR